MHLLIRLRRLAQSGSLAVISLLAGFLLWLAVTEAENPNVVRTLTTGIEIVSVNVPDELAVAAIREPVVTLRVSASEDVFSRLTAADFRAEVNLAGVRQATSDQIVIARVVSNRNVEVVDVSPRIVSVSLETQTSKTVPVSVNRIGTPPQGYTVSAIEPSPANVRITGASSLVQLATSASADVIVTGLRASLQQQVQLTARDSRGADVRGLRVEPASADLRVAILQQEVSLPLSVIPSVQGSLADGYNLLGITTEPTTVAVSGTLELLQALSSLITDPVDISGLRADTTRTVRLRIPAGLQAGRDSVSVRLRVAPALGEVILTVAPQLSNPPEGLQVSLQTSAIEVRLSGEVPTLRGLGPDNVRASVSLGGLSEGVHVLPVSVSVPEGVKVVTISPLRVVVIIRR